MKNTDIDSKKSKISVEEALNSKNLLKKLLEDTSEDNIDKRIEMLLEGRLKAIKDELKRDIKDVLKPKKLELPISIFSTKASTLEIIVKYLKDITKLKLSEIAKLLNRDERTIWSAYDRSTKKKISLKIRSSKIFIPIEIFAERKYSSLEILVSYLKLEHELSFSKIAELLALDQRTVWTVFRRYKKKHD